jgi:GNAT superfamily N-acetyltransferase
VTDAPDPRVRGRHLLGPHVIGQRVVIRRLLRGERGPSGGPAMTDALGVCTSWGDGRATVRTEDGTAVVIALADIVSGKPVPPRPSIRHRVGPAEAQLRALAQWTDLELVELGSWTLRSSATSPNRRANSVLAMTPPMVDDPVSRVAEHYRSRGRRPIAAVLPDSPEEALFRAAGWGAESGDADSLFQIGSVAHARRFVRGLPRLDARRDEDGDHLLLTVGDPDDPVASGRAAYDRDWLGLRAVSVVPERRRQGLGLAVVAALLEWGAERGATTAYLQVIGDNIPALALYEGLGFSTHHAYRYLAEPS